MQEPALASIISGTTEFPSTLYFTLGKFPQMRMIMAHQHHLSQGAVLRLEEGVTICSTWVGYGLKPSLLPSAIRLRGA